MCSMIESGEKGYKLLEQILFNSLVLFSTLYKNNCRVLIFYIFLNSLAHISSSF